MSTVTQREASEKPLPLPLALPETAPSEEEYLMEARDVRKKYCRDLRRSLAYGIRDVANAMLLRRPKPDLLRRDEFWAVDRISFRLGRGDSLGVIGRNGAGKSTLLKLITGQRKLTAGEVVRRGRMVALTEIGLGFDPALTGRENAYINAAVLGLPRQKLEPIIEKIIEFAGIREFIDSPVQTYSSGMRARLGYSVAAHLEPDLLIVDEVLAVGDLQFRRKCIEHVVGYLNRGGAMVLVSHDPYMVQTICKRVIVLDKGRVVFDGDAVDGVNLHFQMGHSAIFERKAGAQSAADSRVSDNSDRAEVRAAPTPDTPVVIDQLEVIPEEGDSLTTGCSAIVSLYCRSVWTGEIAWGFSICTPDMLINIASCGEIHEAKPVMQQGQNVFQCRIPRLPLRAGVFAIRGGVVDGKTLAPIATHGYDNKADFFVVKPEKATKTVNSHLLQNALIEMQTESLNSKKQPKP
jgi:ABC-type polysaccharide/polyol phosphate transport system ATPase subunit